MKAFFWLASPERKQDGLAGLVLVALVLMVYWPAGGYEFTNYDDPDYVAENALVQEGLTWRGVGWAFSTGFTGNWHPLTWLSHMLDWELFGPNPGAHHLSSVVWHALSALVLFVVLKRMSRDFWQSVFVASLFALHPLNVEVVAWVAERKTILSTLFGFLSIWAYVSYAERPALGRYLLVFLTLALGLLAKPLLVTLPFVFLLLDYWPLRRCRTRFSNSEANTGESLRRLIVEKLPLILLSFVSSIVALRVAQHAGAGVLMEQYSFPVRLGNAVVCYVGYLGKMLFPEGLSVLYPHPGMWPLWQVVGAGTLLVFGSLFVVLFWRSRPYLIVGWLWYLGTLVPMIGLVQVSAHSMANRYAYLSLIGLFLMLTWGMAELMSSWPKRRIVAGLAGLIVLGACILSTSAQLKYWKDSVTLFSHALTVTTNNAIAHYNLGQALSTRGQQSEAIQHYRDAIRIKPDYAEAHNNLGLALVMTGQPRLATNHYAQALKGLSDNFAVHFNYGSALAQLGESDQALARLSTSLDLAPENYVADLRMGLVLAGLGRIDEAIDHYRKALRLNPDYLDGLFYLGKTLSEQGKPGEAEEVLSRLTTLNPDSPMAHTQLGLALLKQSKPKQATARFDEALRLKPDLVEALNNLAWVLSTAPEDDIRDGARAVDLARRATDLTQRREPVVLGTLAAAQAEAGLFEEAAATALEAGELAVTLGLTDLAATNRDLATLYKAGRAHREAR